MKQRPKYINVEILEIMGHSKERKSYGVGESVRESGFECFSSFASFNNKPCVKLKELMKLNKKNKVYENANLIYMVSDVEVLILAYKSITNKQKNFTSSVNSVIFSSTNLNWFILISKELKAGKFKIKPARRVNIKFKNQTLNFLIFNSFKDDLTQQSVYLVLTAIYGPSPLNLSDIHDLDQQKIHLVFKKVKQKFQSVK